MSQAERHVAALVAIDQSCATMRQALGVVMTENEASIGVLTEVWGLGVDGPAKTIAALTEAQEKMDSCDKAIFLAQITATHAMTVLKKAMGGTT
jgi:hypothetical protein